MKIRKLIALLVALVPYSSFSETGKYLTLDCRQLTFVETKREGAVAIGMLGGNAQTVQEFVGQNIKIGSTNAFEKGSNSPRLDAESVQVLRIKKLYREGPALTQYYAVQVKLPEYAETLQPTVWAVCTVQTRDSHF